MDKKVEAFTKHIDFIEERDLEQEIPVSFIEASVIRLLIDDRVDDRKFGTVLAVYEALVSAWRLYLDHKEENEENEDEIELFN